MRHPSIVRTLALGLWLAAAGAAQALTGVHPTGVNVNMHGPTTVFLTFQGTAGQTSSEAFWCGDITVPANTVTAFNPCVPGTLYGFLPGRFNLSRASGTQGVSNTTDIMTIPASVARRAYQDAARGERSAFFYVRRFSGPGGDRYVAVTCRLAGGGARVPLALMEVRLAFRTPHGERAITQIGRGETAPPVSARIHYNGSGRIKGRWEVVQPGDPEPSSEDLLTEASLPVERRGLQQRWTVVERFDVFVPPTGRIELPGPSPSRIPTAADGPYKLLLRIEATPDKEGDSNTLAGTAVSGGVAGFPMPVLRYHVMPADTTARAGGLGTLQLLPPAPDPAAPPGAAPLLEWLPVAETALYELEIAGDAEPLLSAVLRADTTRYLAPPWLMDHAGTPVRWRVRALDAQGRERAASAWQALALSP